MDNAEVSEKIKALMERAEAGNASAQFELGEKYRLGEDIEQNYSKAIEWFRKSAEQNYMRGQNAMGVVYATSLGVKQNDKEALEWFHKSAEQGYPAALCNIGIMHELGREVEQSYESAATFYLQAAEKGHANAQGRIGYFYDIGQGVEQSYSQAFYWYSKAAEQNKAAAQYNLGIMYIDGLGVKKDYIKAKEFFLKAAQSNDLDVKFDAIEMQDKAERYELSEKITTIREKILYKLKVDINDTPTMTHYTSMTVGQSLLFDKSPLRLGHINALNDPNEGKLLWHYLGCVPIEAKPVFVGCFLPEDDSLNMWRFYSKDHHKDDACGCAITFDVKDYFDFDLLDNLPQKDQQIEVGIAFSNTGKSPEETNTFYRVIYVDNDIKIHGDGVLSSIEKLFSSLKSETLKFLKENESDAMKFHKLSKLMGPLPYLIKNTDYEAEQEHRIIVTHLEYGASEIKFLEPKIEDGTPPVSPKLYLELHRTNHLAPIKHVTLGPKAPNKEMMAPYWHHKLASEFPELIKNKPDFYVRTSKCAYK